MQVDERFLFVKSKIIKSEILSDLSSGVSEACCW